MKLHHAPLGSAGAGATSVFVRDNNTGGATGSGNVALVVPALTQIGDYVIAFLNFRGSGSGFTAPTPSGTAFTSLIDVQRTTSGRLQIWAKFAESSDLGQTYTWTSSGTTTEQGAILTIANANATTPVNASASTNGSSASTSHVAPAVTTTAANCLVLRAAITAVGSGATGYSWATPAVEYLDFLQSGSGVSNESIAVNLQASAGSSGTDTATFGQSVTYATATIAIAP